VILTVVLVWLGLAVLTAYAMARAHAERDRRDDE
jgi:hypothetical protein